MGWILFLTVFTLAYSSLHGYLFWKIKKALNPCSTVSLVLVAFMLIMIFSPIIVRLTEKAGLEGLARVFAHIGYSWMGMIFLFVCSSLLLDIFRLLIFLAQEILQRGPVQWRPSPLLCFMIALTATCLISVYGFFEAIKIRTEVVQITTSKIPPDFGNIRIVQISDVHMGLTVGKARVKRILKAVADAHPDLFISTGDFADSRPEDLSGISDLFREIRPRYGSYAVTGNHEYYAGIDFSLNITTRLGFSVLRGEAVPVGDFMVIAGVDDSTGRAYGLMKGIPEKELLLSVPPNKFILFLKHRPSVDAGSTGLFDLQLSGHVHRGQIFPFALFVKIFYPYLSGLYALPSGSILYVNRGSGTWGPPIRFMAPPEVTVIDISAAK